MVYIDLIEVDFNDIPQMCEPTANYFIESLSYYEKELLEVARAYANRVVEANTDFITCIPCKKLNSIQTLQGFMFENFICTSYTANLFISEIIELVERLVKQISTAQYKTETPRNVEIYGVLCDILEIRHDLHNRQRYYLPLMKEKFQ